MKICFITASMVGGGTERVISILANHWAGLGHDITILLTADRRVDYKLNASIQLLPITEKTNGSFKGRVERIFKLRKYFRENGDGIFYSFGTETNLFAIIAALFTNTRLILSERSDPNQCGYKLLRDVVYSWGYKFVFQTEQAKDCFSRKIQNRGVVISNPLREDVPDIYEGERKKEIVAVGRLIPLKNHKLLLEAFADFVKMYPDYQLKIYGQGELQQDLEILSDRLGIADKVYFPGFTENVLREIREAFMYVITSDYEGVSNSLLEAMALAIPVIATNCPIGGAASLIEDGLNGVLIPVNDKKALVDNMCRIAGDEQFAKRLSANAGKVRVSNEVDLICRKWLEV